MPRPLSHAPALLAALIALATCTWLATKPAEHTAEAKPEVVLIQRATNYDDIGSEPPTTVPFDSFDPIATRRSPLPPDTYFQPTTRRPFFSPLPAADRLPAAADSWAHLSPTHRDMATQLRRRAAGLATAPIESDPDTPAASQLPRGETPWVCFAPGTDSAVVEALTGSSHGHRVLGTSPGQTAAESGQYTASAFQYLSTPRWTDTAVNDTSFFNRLQQGDATVLTWSIVDDGLNIPGSSGEPSSPSDLRAWLDGLYPGGEAEWLPLFQQVFDRWSEVTGVKYIYEPNDSGTFASRSGRLGTRGDIRIGGHPIDGNYNTLAYNFGPNNGDMVIDTGDSYYNSKSYNSRALRNVVAHEHGHGLGLAHVCPINRTKLMEPTATSSFDGPQFDDIYSAQRQYGDRFEDPDNDDDPEDNDAASRATSLGTLGVGTHRFADLSIDDNSDEDYLRITPAGDDYEMSVTLRPVGGSYLEGAQIGDSCSGGETFNAGSVHDLSLAVLNSNGSSTLASVNSSVAGSAESLQDLALPDGDVLLVIDGDSTNRAQLYELEITLVHVPPPPPPPPVVPVLTIADTQADEDSGVLIFTAQLSESTTVETSVHISVVSGSAHAGTDFTSISGTLTFSPGTTSRSIVVDLLDDDIAEPDETFALEISDAVNLTPPPESPLGAITDDDPSLFADTAPFSLGRVSSSQIDIAFPTIPGRSYTVNYSTDLVTWLPLDSATDIVATASSLAASDKSAGGARRFYQIVETF